MATPFRDDGTVDYEVAAELARFLVAEGSDGLVVAGSTGEGSALSDEERLTLFSAVAQAVTAPVIAGTSTADTARSVVLTSRAARTGVAGILATTPAYARPSQSGLAAHLGAMAEATSLPVMLYDIPVRTGRKIVAETTLAVCRAHTNVVGLKDASGDLPGAARVKAALGSGFDLYSGDDAWTLPFMAIGAAGIVSVAAHWAGPEFAAMVEAAHIGKWDLARELNDRLSASYEFEASEAYPNPLPAKAALRHLGFAVGQCRLPLGPSDLELDDRAVRVVGELRALRG
jgi:4-hydroxy-tetrahydrodipicolinate synthase